MGYISEASWPWEYAALRPGAPHRGKAFPSEACLASCSLSHLLSPGAGRSWVWNLGLSRLLSAGAEQAPVVGERVPALYLSSILEISPESPPTAPSGHFPGLTPHFPRAPSPEALLGGDQPCPGATSVPSSVFFLLASPLQPQAGGGPVHPHGPADHAHHRHHQPERPGQSHTHQAGKAQGCPVHPHHPLGPTSENTMGLRRRLCSPGLHLRHRGLQRVWASHASISGHHHSHPQPGPCWHPAPAAFPQAQRQPPR